MRLLSIALLSILLCSVYACEDDEESEIPDGTFRSIKVNSKLVISDDSLNHAFTVSPTTDTFMLTLSRAYDPIPLAADDEVTYTLYLQLSNGTTSFNWNDEDLVTQRVGIGTSCFCQGIFRSVKEGNISGIFAADGTWQITGSIVLPADVPDDFPENVSGTYRR